MAPRGIERTLSWMSNFRRLELCYERFGEHLQAFRDLATSLTSCEPRPKPWS